MDRKPTPSRKKIAFCEYNKNLCRSLPNVQGDLNEADKICWACGLQNTNLERAHVESYSKFQNNNPENFFLLCARCHANQPDCLPRESQEKWLKQVPFLNEYEDLYDYIFIDIRRIIKEKGLGEDFLDTYLFFNNNTILELVKNHMKNGFAGVFNIRANIRFLLTENFLDYIK